MGVGIGREVWQRVVAEPLPDCERRVKTCAGSCGRPPSMVHGDVHPRGRTGDLLHVVTGASRGIGAAVARALAASHDLVSARSRRVGARRRRRRGRRTPDRRRPDRRRRHGGGRRWHRGVGGARPFRRRRRPRAGRRHHGRRVAPDARRQRGRRCGAHPHTPARPAGRSGPCRVCQLGRRAHRVRRVGQLCGEQVRPRRRSPTRCAPRNPHCASRRCSPAARRPRCNSRVRAAEGEPYAEDDYLRPESVAGAIAYVVNAPDDAHVIELVIRPR